MQSFCLCVGAGGGAHRFQPLTSWISVMLTCQALFGLKLVCFIYNTLMLIMWGVCVCVLTTQLESCFILVQLLGWILPLSRHASSPLSTDADSAQQCNNDLPPSFGVLMFQTQRNIPALNRLFLKGYTNHAAQPLNTHERTPHVHFIAVTSRTIKGVLT